MSGLPERLRESASTFRRYDLFDSEGDGFRLTVQADECDEAADRITQLEADKAVLVEALRPFVAVVTEDVGDDEADSDRFIPMSRYNRAPALTVGDFRNAREALSRIGGEA